MKERNIKELTNIGTVLVDDIVLSDTTLSIYIPVETESEKIKEEREKFQSCVTRGIKEKYPEINLKECTLYTETDLYINTGYRDEHGKYELSFVVGFLSWYEDKNGNEIYDDFSDGFEIELLEEDKAYIKKLIAMKVVDALF